MPGPSDASLLEAKKTQFHYLKNGRQMLNTQVHFEDGSSHHMKYSKAFH